MAARLLEHLGAPGSKIFSAISLPGSRHLHIACRLLGPEVDSASNRNEYEEYFLGVKTAINIENKKLNKLDHLNILGKQ